MGWHSSDPAELFFDNVRVPARNLIGQEGMGFYYIMESFQFKRLIAGIGAIAGPEIGMELTLKYINERQAFGKPIAKYQTIRHDLVDIATEVEAAKQLTYYASWLYEQGETAVKECSMVKLLTTEVPKSSRCVLAIFWRISLCGRIILLSNCTRCPRRYYCGWHVGNYPRDIS